MIDYVTASHDHRILEENLMLSPQFANGCWPPIIQRGYDNIAKAYNRANHSAPVVVYVHHDVFLPRGWEEKLRFAIQQVNAFDPNWGVLGVAGVKLIAGVKRNYGFISDRGQVWGSSAGLPRIVDTLDEMLLVTRGDLRFDENLPLHFYGADICMQARLDGRKSYAVNAFCYHNSGLPFGYRSEAFKTCENYFREKYTHYLPIVTTCAHLS